MSFDSKAIQSSGFRSSDSTLDPTDTRILKELMADARIPRAELGRRVGLSAPAVAERVRRLEEAGVVTGYAAVVDPKRLGYTFAVVIRARPLPGKLEAMARAIRDNSAIVSCERISGDDCFLARAYLRDVAEMETVIDSLVRFGSTNTAIVQSETVTPRPATLLPPTA